MSNVITPVEIVEFCQKKGVEVTVEQVQADLHRGSWSLLAIIAILKEDKEIRDILKSFKEGECTSS